MNSLNNVEDVSSGKQESQFQINGGDVKEIEVQDEYWSE